MKVQGEGRTSIPPRWIVLGVLLLAAVVSALAGLRYVAAAAAAAALWLAISLARRERVWRLAQKTSVAHLPPTLRERVACLPPEAQWDALCRSCAENDKDFRTIAIRCFFLQMNQENETLRAISESGSDEHLEAVLHSPMIGFYWGCFCLIGFVVEDYSSYILNLTASLPCARRCAARCFAR